MQNNVIETPTATAREMPKCRQLGSTEKDRLFNKYIVPHLNDIRRLVKYYTFDYQDVDDNYNICLMQLYNYIGSYDPSQKVSTWYGISVKRACVNQGKKRAEEMSYLTDIEMCSRDDIYQHGNSMIAEAEYGTLIDNLSDEVYNALMQISPQRLSPFMMYVQGLRIREITEAEWKLGHLEKRSEDIVKSRIYWARRELQYILRQHEITRKNRKGPANDRGYCEEDD